MARAYLVAGRRRRGRRLEGQGDGGPRRDRRPGRSRADRGRPGDAAVGRRLHSGPPHAQPGGPSHVRHQARDPALEPGGDLRRDARRREAGRPSWLRPSLDVGPRLRDLRRPAPADLRRLVAAQRLGPRDGADPARPPGRRQHVPQPGDRRQVRGDPGPRQRRPGDPGRRRRVDGAGAHGPRHRLRQRVRSAARLARRIGRRDARAPRWQDGHARRRAATMRSGTLSTCPSRSRPTCRS